MGKAQSARNAYKGGSRNTFRELSRLLKDNERELRKQSPLFAYCPRR